MTEEVYRNPLRSFKTEVVPAPVYTVPLLQKGKAALEEINEELGLGFDEWDKDFYLNMFTQELKRDPTSVELFDMAQSNSEHRCHLVSVHAEDITIHCMGVPLNIELDKSCFWTDYSTRTSSGSSDDNDTTCCTSCFSESVFPVQNCTALFSAFGVRPLVISFFYRCQHRVLLHVAIYSSMVLILAIIVCLLCAIW